MARYEYTLPVSELFGSKSVGYLHTGNNKYHSCSYCAGRLFEFLYFSMTSKLYIYWCLECYIRSGRKRKTLKFSAMPIDVEFIETSKPLQQRLRFINHKQ